MTNLEIRRFVGSWSMSALVVALALSVGACNNQTGFSGSVGSTPNGPRLTTYQILGTVGTPFSATVEDSRSSWAIQGNVPLDIVICNNILPAAVIATKTVSNNNLLSVEIITGNHVADLQSTMAPFGTVMLQVGGAITTTPTAATPDLRIFVSGPLNERYQALIEDIDTGFVIESRAPTLILFDTPNGKVTGQFFGNQDFGTFDLQMLLNGQVVATVMQGPDATIREP